MQVKGRYLVIGWTMVFLAVAGTIVIRTRRAYGTQDALRAIRDSVQAATATRDKVKVAINRLESRPYLGPRLLESGLHTPTDSIVFRLQLPPGH